MGDQAVGTSREVPHLSLPTEAGTEGHGRHCGGTPVASPRSSCLPGAHPHGLLLQDQKVSALAGGKQAGPLHAPGTEREPDHGRGEVLAWVSSHGVCVKSRQGGQGRCGCSLLSVWLPFSGRCWFIHCVDHSDLQVSALITYYYIATVSS